MTMTRSMRALVGVLAFTAVFPGTAMADRHWHGGDIHRFHQHDMQRWQGGSWHHGDHLGRLGWWWVVAGAWYFYPQPVYPYPDPYTPPVVTVPAPAVGQYWYYCDAARTYYPYVATCPSGWRQVPAAPQ
ncbi:MAG TPA: hypothetical protein VFF82_04300 [Rhodocyclaceae bacterium]|nr:hypothetical protein [Rhodocyclaceae bacterium]